MTIEPDVEFDLTISIKATAKGLKQITAVTDDLFDLVTNAVKVVTGFDPIALDVRISIDYPSPIFVLGRGRKQ